MIHTLIIGAGAIGIAMGASLYSQGMEVTFFARENTGKAIREGGVRRTGLFGEIAVPAGEIAVIEDLADLADYSIDYVLVCTKTLANADVAAKLADQREKRKVDGKIVIMQNGWGNDVPFRAYFSEEEIYQARVITGFSRTAPNVSNITVHTAPILLGSLYGKNTDCMEPLAHAVAASGIPCETTAVLSEALWAKMLYNTTLNPLGAILRVPYGKLAESDDSRAIMDRLIDETFAVMKCHGYHTFWETPEDYKSEFYNKLIPDTSAHRSSMLQDMEKKQKTEIDTLNGCIDCLADQYNLEVPTHRMICELIRALEYTY
ncbi:MAG: 2-dehydropantoate 2-reductase [Clostridiales bacterium]|nr:2-dehydropantoate 2-reductase [Clostridiales bacterium]